MTDPIAIMAANMLRLEAKIRDIQDAADPAGTPANQGEFDLEGDGPVRDYMGWDGLVPLGTWPGFGYNGGVKVDNLNTDATKPCIKCVKGGTTTEDAGPMPSTFPENEIWFEKKRLTAPFYAWCDA